MTSRFGTIVSTLFSFRKSAGDGLHSYQYPLRMEEHGTGKMKTEGSENITRPSEGYNKLIKSAL